MRACFHANLHSDRYSQIPEDRRSPPRPAAIPRTPAAHCRPSVRSPPFLPLGVTVYWFFNSIFSFSVFFSSVLCQTTSTGKAKQKNETKRTRVRCCCYYYYFYYYYYYLPRPGSGRARRLPSGRRVFERAGRVLGWGFTNAGLEVGRGDSSSVKVCYV